MGKRFLVLLLLIFISAVPVFSQENEIQQKESSGTSHGDQSRSQRYPPSIRQIMDRKKLIVAMYSKDIPPFFMHDENGKFYGLDVEMAQDIAIKLGVDVQFNRRAQNFDELIEILTNHEADVIISLLSRTLERAINVRFTRPYIILRQGLLLNRVQISRLKSKGNLLKILDNKNVTIGVKLGTAYESFVKQLFPNAKIAGYPDWDPFIIDAVLKGEIVGAFHDEIEVKKVIAGKPDVALELQTVVIEDSQDPIAMAVPWDSPGLLAWLELYLEMADINLTADTLLKRYDEIFK
jgi:ABC-type amino acid transport substrate-binding protein